MWIDVKLRDDNRDISHLSFLFDSYEPRFFWWEVVEIIKKVLVACVAVVILPGSPAQSVFALFVTSIYTVLTTWAQPYLQDSDDTASLLANVGLWLTSFYLLLSKSKVLTGTDSANVAAGIVLVAVQCVIAIVLVMSNALKAVMALWTWCMKRSVAAAVPMQSRTCLQRVCCLGRKTDASDSQYTAAVNASRNELLEEFKLITPALPMRQRVQLMGSKDQRDTMFRLANKSLKSRSGSGSSTGSPSLSPSSPRRQSAVPSFALSGGEQDSEAPAPLGAPTTMAWKVNPIGPATVREASDTLSV